MDNIEELISLSSKPDIFTPGDSFIWNDEHISKHMLISHLDPDTDAASYRHRTIDEIVGFITTNYLQQKNDIKILDTGCGPGLYCEKFAKAGYSVTGIDISENSLAYARKTAKEKGLDINYVCGDYLEMSYKDAFDMVIIISQDICVLSNINRERYLRNVYKALKPGGYFIFDASTPKTEGEISEYSKWYAGRSDFWSDEPYLVLENRFYYKSDMTYLNQYILITKNKKKIFRIYQTHFTVETVKGSLGSCNFEIADIFEDLTGRKYTEGSKTIGVIAQK